MQPRAEPPTASTRLGSGSSLGARQSSLRDANLALVTRTVCASQGPLSRAGVAVRTSMTRSTVSRLVDDLVAGGVLDELEPPAVAGPGRPATPLVPGIGLAALGLQVNATYLAARVIDLRGRVVVERIEYGDFVGCEPQPTLDRLAGLSRAALGTVPTGTRLAGAGLALPGIVSTGTGRLLLAPNLGWSDVRPADVVNGAATDGLPLRIDNEANLAARTVAEHAPGHPGSLTDFVYLSGEIGIGGAVVIDGELMTGRHGWAGEIGHVCVDPGGPPCPCGSTGCLEQFAGRRALFSAAGMPPDASPPELAARVAAGDPRAVDALAGAARALAVVLGGVVNVLDIPAVVLGGHLGQITELLRGDLEHQLSSRVLSSRWAAPTLHAADQDVAPGATGAALQELSAVVADPVGWLG